MCHIFLTCAHLIMTKKFSQNVSREIKECFHVAKWVNLTDPYHFHTDPYPESHFAADPEPVLQITQQIFI
jgi:hypothetical protein